MQSAAHSAMLCAITCTLTLPMIMNCITVQLLMMLGKERLNAVFALANVLGKT